MTALKRKDDQTFTKLEHIKFILKICSSKSRKVLYSVKSQVRATRRVKSLLWKWYSQFSKLLVCESKSDLLKSQVIHIKWKNMEILTQMLVLSAREDSESVRRSAFGVRDWTVSLFMKFGKVYFPSLNINFAMLNSRHLVQIFHFGVSSSLEFIMNETWALIKSQLFFSPHARVLL